MATGFGRRRLQQGGTAIQKFSDLCLRDFWDFIDGHRIGTSPVAPSNRSAGWMLAVNNRLLTVPEYFDFSLGPTDCSFSRLPGLCLIKQRKTRRSGTTPYECAEWTVLARLSHDLKGDLRIVDIQIHATQTAEQRARVECVISYVQDRF